MCAVGDGGRERARVLECIVTWKQWGSLDSCVSMSIHCLCSLGVKSQPLVDYGFSTRLAFTAGYPEAFSSSWIGMASVANLSIPFTILIQDSVWSLNKDWTWTSILHLPCLLQTWVSETGLNRTLLWIHPFFLFRFDLEATYILGIKIDFLLLLVTDCPTSTHLKLASEHSLGNIWSSDNFSNRCLYSCNKFPFRSSLACVFARGGSVGISCFSSWLDATGLPGVLRSTDNSAIISATAPWYWADWRRRPARKYFCILFNCWHVIHHFLLHPMQCRWTLTWRWPCLWYSLVHTVVFPSSFESIELPGCFPQVFLTMEKTASM